MEIKDKFKKFRLMTKLRQKDCAELFGVRLTTWQAYEYGVNNPSKSKLIILKHEIEKRGLDLEAP